MPDKALPLKRSLGMLRNTKIILLDTEDKLSHNYQKSQDVYWNVDADRDKWFLCTLVSFYRQKPRSCISCKKEY